MGHGNKARFQVTKSAATMICPYKLTANPEDVASWVKFSLPRARVDDSRWQEGVFPIVSHELDSADPAIKWMSPGKKGDQQQSQYVISAGVLTSDSKAWDAFCKRRCLILVSALRVERKRSNEVQEVFDLRPADKSLFALAGVWGDAITADGTGTRAFSAITVRPSILLGDLFREMPVIVARGDYTRWLRTQSESAPPTDVLRPFSAVELKRWIMLPEGKLRTHLDDQMF